MNSDVSDGIQNYINSIDYGSILKKSQHLSYSKITNEVELTNEYVHSLQYRNIYIGRYIASHLIRFCPELVAKFHPDRNHLRGCLRNIYCYLLLIDQLQSYCTIKFSFFTETVYLGGALVEYLNSIGTTLPFIYYKQPVTLKSTQCLNSFKGKSLVYQALEHRFHLFELNASGLTETQKYLIQLSGKNILEQRIRSVYKLNSKSDASSEKNVWEFFQLAAFQPERILQAEEECNSLLKDGRQTFILYLHCFADGPYWEGYSGYATSYQYFSHFAALLSSLSSVVREPPRILIKPHPNIINGFSSPFPHDQEKAQQDLDNTLALLNQISSNSDIECFLVNPFINNSIFLDKDKDDLAAVHVTHHGSVGLEALYRGKKLICSDCAVYAGLGFGEIVLTPAAKSEDIIKELDRNKNRIPYDPERIEVFAGLEEFYSEFDVNSAISKFTRTTYSQALLERMPTGERSSTELNAIEENLISRYVEKVRDRLEKEV
ncbi:hypothetical protein ETE01_02260 [Synechococcus sp. HB1133]|nr:hypothetical protein [Synechococcus sp. HBA1120]NHI80604.1 hypothetical protein [Synechococcus sp. HB1133]